MFGLSGIWLKVVAGGILLAVIVGVPAWGSWKLGAQSTKEEAQKETERQVTQVRGEYQQLLTKQIQLTDKYQGLAQTGYDKLMAKLGSITAQQVGIAKGLEAERETNKAFYDQLIPEGGKAQWEASRKLLQ